MLPEKQQFRGPKVERKTPNCQKNRKVSYRCFERSKTSLERIRVPHNAFSCNDTISRGTVRRILKKYGVSRNAAKKVSLKKKSKCFRSKWCINMLKKPFSFWHNVVLIDKTRVRISSDGIVRNFRRNGTRFLEKNTNNLSSDKRSLMF